ncbi:hypothetical protein [Aquisphaera insulae]|uniref:hypothetical protein n=1 Tax=Aquisphaera insulae TaxID=2712864 RepID=UPI0013EB4051|nr:hypothetical protein [Aquisphaera insulae]
MGQPAPASPPWWLVPNLLALDAPAVAVVWQRFLAARFGTPVPWSATVALAAVVWCVYLADRCLDARRGDLDADRHRIAVRFPRAFAGLAAAGLFIAVAAVAQLPASYFVVGLWVGAGVVAYLTVVHLARGAAGRGAKELLVGAAFAAGVTVPLLAAGPRPAEWGPSAVVFGGLCWLNCRLIERWEGRRAWPGDTALAAAVMTSAATLPPMVGLAAAGAGAGLLAVHVTCRRRPRAARVLADVVLLTPLPLLAVGWRA